MKDVDYASIQYEAAIRYLQGPRNLQIDLKSVRFYVKWVQQIRG
jgi:hypothetical protein